MLRCLTTLSWERVDVNFSRSRQRFLAHSTIQARFAILLQFHLGNGVFLFTFFLQTYIWYLTLYDSASALNKKCILECNIIFSSVFRWKPTVSIPMEPRWSNIWLTIFSCKGCLLYRFYVNASLVLIGIKKEFFGWLCEAWFNLLDGSSL